MKNIFKNKTQFLDWAEYSNSINQIDTFLFQQETRKSSLKNMAGCGVKE